MPKAMDQNAHLIATNFSLIYEVVFVCLKRRHRTTTLIVRLADSYFFRINSSTTSSSVTEARSEQFSRSALVYSYFSLVISLTLLDQRVRGGPLTFSTTTPTSFDYKACTSLWLHQHRVPTLCYRLQFADAERNPYTLRHYPSPLQVRRSKRVTLAQDQDEPLRCLTAALSDLGKK